SVTQKLQSLAYNVADWDDSFTESKLISEIVQVLKTSSKKGNGNAGFPDRIFVNKHEKLLILVEEKSNVKDHDNPDIEKGAISGIKWYLSRFFNTNLKKELKGFFDNWKILGIAVSGDLSVEYQHKFSCYTFDAKSEKIILLNRVVNFMTEEQFLALFNSLDEEKAVAIVSSSSKKINILLRNVDSQKRPILLSALMICLHRVKSNSENYINDFPDHYKTYSAKTIITNLLDTVKNILKVEGIPNEKLDTLSTELAFLTTDQTLNNSDILKNILIELETAVIPLFETQFATNSNYDIIGKFYEEFLKYAGVSNTKKGIVLTPRHITTLFTKLVDLRDNDKIVDICCGTGAFLIAGMNALINKIEKSGRTDKNEAIANVKTNQLLGFELNPTMYICAVSNMLFRGDGKSSIFNYDSIHNPKTQEELDKFGATIGFINPPYSGDGKHTPKEITFLTKLLDNCSRYAVIIAPLSTYFKEDNIREAILEKHTLKYVINMPPDLFMPNAATNTAIAVFQTNRSFDPTTDEVTFYDLKNDGFVLSKNQGRTDVYNRWENIEKQLLETLKPTSIPDEITLVRTKITPKDEWIIHAHSKTDYSTLCEENFIKSVSDYMIFEAKRDLDILDKELTEAELFLFLKSYLKETLNVKKYNQIDTTNWKEFNLIGKNGLFDYQHGSRLVKPERIVGEIPLITAGMKNQGYAQTISNYEIEDCYEAGVTIDMFSNSFFQNFTFAADDNIYIFNKPQKLNKYIGLFLVTIIKKQQYKYGYGRQFRKEDAEKNKILLPVISDGSPDWNFMENYIKNLPYGDLI
ncbi:MAG: SAM-dependent methyltransferase, partial [Prevotellaceae bacterium]|nr:SAM-dependent methyltransferase [Prevotellaceae bacterium]